MKKTCLLAAGILATSLLGSSRAATIDLFEYGFNIDGTFSDLIPDGDPTPGGIMLGGFNSTTGLGTIQFSISGAGSHYFSTYYDHEIDETINTFFNEMGSKSGTPGSGQSWEIDEPASGDIFRNFLDGILDNSVGLSSPEDVAMALGWKFNLGAFDTAKITLLTSDTAPTSGFYLEQNDPDSQASIYLSGSLSIVTRNPNPNGVPDQGGSIALLALGLAGIFGAQRFLTGAASIKV
jgi:hypothetical protein